MNLLISVLLLFFYFRNARDIADVVYNNLPFPSQMKTQIGEKMIAVFDAVVKGNLLIAVAQGIVIGMLFWIFQLPTPILYGTIGVFLGLIPVVGTNVLWIPASIYLYYRIAPGTSIVFGSIAFLAYLFLENIAKPMLLDKELNLHPLLLLMALLGGLAEFGVKGLILGPFCVTVFLSLWQMIKIWNASNEPAT
jgi:predicted PurR-regulated permease PerM